MHFDIVTIFPEFFTSPLDYGIVRRAREARLIETELHDLRRFTHDRHRTVDDRPFGGGAGMVLKPEPLFEAVESILGSSGAGLPLKTEVVLLSASGRLFEQGMARRFSQLERIVLLCGRYEGVDERVAEHLATEEVSVGNFVLSGGELPAAMILDAATRLIPGALGNEDSSVEESFSILNEIPKDVALDTMKPAPAARSAGILDYPHYTRPQDFRGWEVPEVLVSGNHEEIRRWRHEMALRKTLRNRPELLSSVAREELQHERLKES
ncbi:MAG: tRNA (guanosine(37)-N1)-methyltransferase TrmD [Candidatus Acidiferrales bacterium]